MLALNSNELRNHISGLFLDIGLVEMSYSADESHMHLGFDDYKKMFMVVKVGVPTASEYLYKYREDLTEDTTIEFVSGLLDELIKYVEALQ